MIGKSSSQGGTITISRQPTALEQIATDRYGHRVSKSDQPYLFDFACQRSGNCCARPQGFVRVTGADVAAIAEHLGLSEQGVRSRYLMRGSDRLVAGLGTRCVFLDESAGEAACAIYPVRPARCQSWPYWDELRGESAMLTEATRFCPGIKARDE